MYDIAIIGSGVSALFLAQTLLDNKSDLNILMIEKGNLFSQRECPIEKKISKKCMDCNICHRLQGFGGLLRSEGKFNFTNDFGGNLHDKVGEESTSNLFSSVDDILCSYGGDKVSTYTTNNEYLIDKVKDTNCKVLHSLVRHLGTSISYDIVNQMYEFLKDNIEIRLETLVTQITKEDDVFNLETKNGIIKAKKVVLATGVNSTDYLNQFNISNQKTRVDIGLRVEMKSNQLDAILNNCIETKLRYTSSEYEATTYCMNKNGKVIKKYHDGLVMADGQNCNEVGQQSNNLNFTVFVPRYFNNVEDAKAIISKSIRYQRLGEIIGVKTNNFIEPSLDVKHGVLQELFPQVYIDAALQIIKSIEELIGDNVDPDTILYGVDAKFYKPEIETSKYFETKVKGLYAIGDCSGVTHSLSQAAASGVYLGMHLTN